MERFKISEKSSGSRVFKVEAPASAEVTGFEFRDLRKAHQGYEQVKAKFGSLVPTDPERSARPQKDRRFALNELIRDQFAVDEEERRRIDEKVKVEIDAIREQARQAAAEEGYKAGFEQGRQEALAQYQAAGAEHLDQLQRLLGELESAKGEIFRANEKLILELLHKLCRNVVLRELETDKDYLARLTKELVDRVGAREFIRIRVRHEDLEHFGKIQEAVLAAIGRLKNVSIEPSDQIPSGGCLLETEWNALDASIERQLENIHRELVEGAHATEARAG